MTPHPPDPSPAAVAQSERHFQTLIEQAADGIFMSDAQGRIVLANTRMYEMLGYGRDEIVGLNVLETYMPEDRDQGRARMAQMPAGETLRFERLARRKDGTSIPVDVSVAWLPDGERQSIMRDVSRRKVGEEARRLDDRRLRALVRLSEFESHSLKEMLDVALEEVVHLSDSVFGYIYFYDDQTELFALHSWSKEVMAACTVANPEGIYELDKTGIWGEAVRQRKPIVVNDFAAPHPLKRGYPEGHAGLTNFMTIPVVSRGRIVAVVGVANKATDYTDADVSQLTQMMDIVWKVAERQQAEDELRQLAQDLECRVEERTREFEAANAELEAANAELEAANAKLQQMLVDEEVLQAELAHRALHDPLTGLANRTLFGQRLDYAFQVSGRGVAVLWIDLDHFKEVNDIFGHDTGDELLVAVADRLREMVRDTDDIARMGGDEFAIVLPNVAPNKAQMVAERILAALTDPSAFRLQIAASIGVGWQASQNGSDHRALIKLADEAMYRAKAAGGGRALA